ADVIGEELSAGTTVTGQQFSRSQVTYQPQVLRDGSTGGEDVRSGAEGDDNRGPVNFVRVDDDWGLASQQGVYYVEEGEGIHTSEYDGGGEYGGGNDESVGRKEKEGIVKEMDDGEIVSEEKEGEIVREKEEEANMREKEGDEIMREKEEEAIMRENEGEIMREKEEEAIMREKEGDEITREKEIVEIMRRKLEAEFLRRKAQILRRKEKQETESRKAKMLNSDELGNQLDDQKEEDEEGTSISQESTSDFLLDKGVESYIQDFLSSSGGRPRTSGEVDSVVVDMGAFRSYHDEVVANLTRQSVDTEQRVGSTPEAVECGGVITISDDSSYQTITSPGFPSAYPPNVECEWTIIAQMGTNSDRLRLWITDFRVEGGECWFDRLTITDNAVGSSVDYCGSKYEEWTTSMGNSLTISFTTDSTIELQGFVIGVLGLKATCGGIIQTLGTQALTFSTTNYPDAYPPETICHWLVVSKAELALRLSSFRVNPKDQGTMRVLTRPFGPYELYDPEKVYFSNVLSVTFFADKTAHDTHLHPGLQFQVLPVARISTCNQTVSVSNENTVAIMSSKYPIGYAPSKHCWWTIKYDISDDYRASVRFVDFDIENHDECAYDRLEIFDGKIGKSRNFCGKRNKFKYETDSKELVLYFHSDSYNMQFHKGFCIFASAHRIQRDKCLVEKPDDHTWVIKSPPSSTITPIYTVCNISIASQQSQRFGIRFNQFNLQRNEDCKKGSYLSIDDQWLSRTEMFCGHMDNHYFITPSNNLQLYYSSESTDLTHGFEVQIKAEEDSQCGGNYILKAGDVEELVAPTEVSVGQECVWVLQGQRSYLVLEFATLGGDVQVSQTGLYNNLYTYNTRTLHFIEPSQKYMIVTKEAGIRITVTAYKTFSRCDLVVDLQTEPVIMTNLGVLPCSQVARLPSQDATAIQIFQYTLLSATSHCSLTVVDREEGVTRNLCTDDWRVKYVTSSKKLNIKAITQEGGEVNNYMLLIELFTYTCGDTYDVENKITVRSKNVRDNTPCVYRFLANGYRIVLDVATSSRKALSYVIISTDGSFQSLKELSYSTTTSLETTKEFLVLIKPFPKTVSFVLQVMREETATSPCDTCIILQGGSQGVLSSPNSQGLSTYPSDLSCSIKFEGEDQNYNVALEILQLNLPRNTSIDCLLVVKDNKKTILDSTLCKPLPFLLLTDTPFTLKFMSLSNNIYKGYKIRYKANDCGGKVILKNENSVTIQSPGYSTGGYPRYVHCIWLISTNITNISDRIKFKMIDFDVHNSDSFEVFDPLFSHDPLAVFRGSAASLGLKSIGNELRVVFKSDSRQVGAGFSFRVRALVSGCGGDIDTTKTKRGTISTNDYYPKTNYCLFRLKANDGRVLSLSPLLHSHATRRVKKVSKPFLSRVGGKKVSAVKDDDDDDDEEEEEDDCKRVSIIVSTKGLLSTGQRYCATDVLPTVLATNDIIVVANAPSLLPAAFTYHTDGCGGDVEETSGILTSPNHPDVFSGPITCTWTFRYQVMFALTHLNLDPHLDSLTLTDRTQSITWTGSKVPGHALLGAPGTVTFSGVSVGVQTGFSLRYEMVDVQGTWQVSQSDPAVILGWQGGGTTPLAWQVRSGQGDIGLTVRIWAAYLPSDASCSFSYLQVVSAGQVEQRLCGGTVLRTIHVPATSLIIILHSPSPMAFFTASVHLTA
ncbi:hypothetical protein Pcinc_044167, partial [Petrolisthes cinctipes]